MPAPGRGVGARSYNVLSAIFDRWFKKYMNTKNWKDDLAKLRNDIGMMNGSEQRGQLIDNGFSQQVNANGTKVMAKGMGHGTDAFIRTVEMKKDPDTGAWQYRVVDYDANDEDMTTPIRMCKEPYTDFKKAMSDISSEKSKNIITADEYDQRNGTNLSGNHPENDENDDKVLEEAKNDPLELTDFTFEDAPEGELPEGDEKPMLPEPSPEYELPEGEEQDDGGESPEKEDKPDTCKGTCEDGTPCNNPVAEGEEYCHLHGGEKTSMYEEMMRMVAECMPKQRCAYVKDNKRCKRAAKVNGYCTQHAKILGKIAYRVPDAQAMRDKAGQWMFHGKPGDNAVNFLDFLWTERFVDNEGQEMLYDLIVHDYPNFDTDLDCADDFIDWLEGERYASSNINAVQWSAELDSYNDIRKYTGFAHGEGVCNLNVWYSESSNGWVGCYYEGWGGRADGYFGPFATYEDAIFEGSLIAANIAGFDDYIVTLFGNKIAKTAGSANCLVQLWNIDGSSYDEYERGARRADNFATAPRIPDDVDIDSNNVEACPLCGDPNFDGSFCNVCGYEEPPEGFDDIDLETPESYDEYAEDLLEDEADSGKPEFDPDEVELERELEDKADELTDNAEKYEEPTDDEMAFA